MMDKEGTGALEREQKDVVAIKGEMEKHSMETPLGGWRDSNTGRGTERGTGSIKVS